MGSLYWQLNSEWPGASKSSLEYLGRWKVLHHETRRFYAPLHTSAWLTAADDVVGVHVANDRPAAVRVNVTVGVYDFHGRRLYAGCPVKGPKASGEQPVAGASSACMLALASGSGTVVFCSPLAAILVRAPGCSADSCFLSVETRVISHVGAPPLLLDRPEVLFPRQLARATLPAAAVNVSLAMGGGDVSRPVQLLVYSPSLALFVTLQSPHAGVFLPNVLHLLPGEAVPVAFHLTPEPQPLMDPTWTPGDLLASLVVLCVNSVGDCRAAATRTPSAAAVIL